MKTNHKIRLVGLDLDGTLLRNDKTISPFTQNALISAAQRGIVLVPVTGRPLSGIPECITRLGVCDYAITTNGAAITQLKTGKRVYSAPIPYEKTVLIMKRLDRADISFEAFANGCGYISPAVMAQYNKKYAGTPVGEYIQSSRRVVESPLSEFERKKMRADEIFISCRSAQERKTLAQEFGGDDGLQLCMLEDAFLELTNRGTDKGCAFARLCQMLGINKENTAAFGDNANDEPLVRAAGLFVAMGNAREDFKKTSDMVADTNEHDGVAKILNKF